MQIFSVDSLKKGKSAYRIPGMRSVDISVYALNHHDG